MALAETTTPQQTVREFAVRKIEIQDLHIALAQGWQDFRAKRGDLLFLGIIYPIVMLIVCSAALDFSILPLVFPLIAGSVIFGPAIASGYYEIARRREQGLDTSWRHFFDVLRGPAAVNLAGLTSITVMLFIAWMLSAALVYATTLGAMFPDGFASLGQFLHAILATSEGWQMIIAGNLVGLAFVLVALAVSIVSFPMVVDRRVGWNVALRTSIRVMRTNPVTTSVWGLIVVTLSILGALPALVGLAVVFPVLGYATWHLYTRAVIR